MKIFFHVQTKYRTDSSPDMCPLDKGRVQVSTDLRKPVKVNKHHRKSWVEPQILNKMSLLGKLILLFLTVFSILAFIVFIRTFTLHVKQADILECKESDLDFIPASHEVLQRFRTALRFDTVSREPHDYNRDALFRFITFIQEGLYIEDMSFIRCITFPRLVSVPKVEYRSYIH